MNKKQISLYKQATENILNSINSLNIDKSNKDKAVKFVKLFRKSFQLPDVKYTTFVDKSGDISDLGYDSAGFCKVSSALFSILMGITDWKLMYIDKTQWNQGSHHFLQHTPTSTIIDLTYDQFQDDANNIIPVPYHLGKQVYNYEISPGEKTRKFATKLGIDIIKALKEQSTKN